MLVDGQPVVIDFGIAHVPDSTRLTQDRHGDGHARVPGAGGHRGPGEQRRVRRALLGRDRGVRGDRAAAVRQRHLPDDLLPGAARGRRSSTGVPAALLPLRRRGAVHRAAGPAARRWLAGPLRRSCRWAAACRRHVGPNGTRLSTASVGAPLANGLTGSRLRAARAGAAPFVPAPAPAFRGPSEAAADVADLLPPVRALPAPAAAAAAAAPRPAATAPVAGLGLVSLAFAVMPRWRSAWCFLLRAPRSCSR